MKDNIHIGEVIKSCRVAAGLSQEELAESICSREYLGKVERGLNAPTIEVIDSLSERLNQNIYELYSLLLKHSDIKTHIKIESMNEYFTYGKISEILPLLEECSADPAFQTGEPFQILMYGYALYYSLTLRQYSTSIDYSLKGLLSKYRTTDQICSLKHHYSNVDITLMQHWAVNICRLNDNAGLDILNFLLEYLFQTLSDSQYRVNAVHRFESKIIGPVCYNKFLFQKAFDIALSESDLSQLNTSISLMKKNSSMYFLPELLLIRGNIYKKSGNNDAADFDLKTGKALGSFLYDDTYLEKIIKEAASI
ncbi:MAG: helix-turn-helix transcriptional regulator [Lachnospiraceae bacterium]|nr:helix-turn-helix transcriptional regulator [Lachnospiraceae bacterium]